MDVTGWVGLVLSPPTHCYLYTSPRPVILHYQKNQKKNHRKDRRPFLAQRLSEFLPLGLLDKCAEYRPQVLGARTVALRSSGLGITTTSQTDPPPRSDLVGREPTWPGGEALGLESARTQVRLSASAHLSFSSKQIVIYGHLSCDFALHY